MNSGRNNLLTTLIDTFFPRRCPGCGSYDVWVCEACIVKTSEPKIEYWDRSVIEPTITQDGISAAHIEQFVSLGIYHQPLLETAMELYKFHRAMELADIFAQLLAPGVHTLLKAIDRTSNQSIILIPVPLHKQRIRERGFDQNLLLAEKITVALNQLMLEHSVSCRSDLILRTRYTAHQTSVNADTRMANLEDAFTLTSAAVEIIPNATIILIDDIVTTGATLNTLTTVIRPLQPRHISAASVLRSSGK